MKRRVDHLTFADVRGTETFYLPYTTDAERYARSLAPSVWEWQRRIAFANLAGDWSILVPHRSSVQDRALHGATLLGVPIAVADVDGPMIATPLSLSVVIGGE